MDFFLLKQQAKHIRQYDCHTGEVFVQSGIISSGTNQAAVGREKENGKFAFENVAQVSV